MLNSLINHNNPSSAVWLAALSSAFRTAMACSIVAGATLYGPYALRRHFPFPAFSYVTVILIVTGASLGDTLHGCWDAFCATVLTVFPAMLGLWIVGPANLTTAVTSFLVALAAFVVMLPEHKTRLVSKRIALGQVVIIYVIAYDKGGVADPIMHPAHVASSTAIGVLACLLALLLPYPSLASSQVKNNCKLFGENALERLKLCVKAFCEEDSTNAQAFVSQAKSLAIVGTKLLQSINSKQESMKWETLPIKFLKPYFTNPTQKLKDMEMAIKGMEMALSHFHSFPSQFLNPNLKRGVLKLQDNIIQNFNQVEFRTPFENTIFSRRPFPQTQKDLPHFFFLFCFELLQSKIIIDSLENSPPKSLTDDSQDERSNFVEWVRRSSLGMNKRIILALKCSLSVGFAVLFGLMYSKNNAIWSGLPVAISFAISREATFRVTHLKIQGTVLGTVYGVVVCFLLEKYVKFRFLVLLPWFILCSLLRKSRMYGPAGGVSAVIGAVLILGRDKFGPPTEFAINRIVEAFIGLSCAVIIEIMFQPRRASSLAKIQLSNTLKVLNECIYEVSLGGSKYSIGDSQKKLKANVNELKKLIEEAEMEPNFWFLPFHGVCYNKLLKSLSKMVDLLAFFNHASGTLEQQYSKGRKSWNFSLEKLEGELEMFKGLILPSIKCFERVILVKSLNTFELEIKMQESGTYDTSSDIELGKLPNCSNMFNAHGSNVEDEMDNMVNSHLQILKEIYLARVDGGCEEEEVIKEDVVLGLIAMIFCMSGLVKETREIEKEIKEILQWENPSSHINLHEISCKIHVLYNV